MRRYGLCDMTRGLLTAGAAGVAGLVLWNATRVGTQSTSRFWAAMAIVAVAGLVLALSQIVVGVRSKGLRLRVSLATFLLAFLPVLVCVGWILLSSQPGDGWQEGRIASWSRSLGVQDVVHDLALWHGVLAFAFGLVLGFSFSLDAVPKRVVAPAVASRQPPGPDDQAETVADEPLAAERAASADDLPPRAQRAPE